MDKAAKKNTTDQAVLAVMQDAAPVAYPANPSRSVAEDLRAMHARIETESQADARNKAEVEGLIQRLIQKNIEEKTMLRRHADARMERQSDNLAKTQVETDEREKHLDETRDILYEISGKLQGDHPFPIFLPGDQRPTPQPPRKRKWWK